MADSKEHEDLPVTSASTESIDAPHRQGATRPSLLRQTLRGLTLFGVALLVVEFLDELVFGVREAAWPLIRDDLHLNYAEIGLLLGIPAFASNIIEPFIGILGDVWRRRVLVLGGGVVYGLAVLAAAASGNFILLLLSFVLLYPASGSFVSLSQATLMDMDPSRHEQSMARWTFAGSIGVVVGSLAVSAGTFAGVGWRPLFVGLGVLTFVIVAFVWRFRFPATGEEGEDEEKLSFRQGIFNMFSALRRAEVLRWLTLLEFSNFMLDVLLGFLALYFTDVAHVPPEQAALAVLVWTVVGLVGDFLIIPVLERVPGVNYLRVSAVLEFVFFAAFLLVPYLWAKFALLALLGLFNSGWYSILMGRLYSAMPGQSGTVMAVSNIFGLVEALLPAAFGWVAAVYGLQATMWLLLLGPVALLVGLPRRSATTELQT